MTEDQCLLACSVIVWTLALAFDIAYRMVYGWLWAAAVFFVECVGFFGPVTWTLLMRRVR